jgi:hypothetical protein
VNHTIIPPQDLGIMWNLNAGLEKVEFEDVWRTIFAARAAPH